MRIHAFIGLLICVAICLAAGGLSGLATASSVRDWYPTLAKPWFTPPSWVFGPVWTMLYAMMGVSLWLAWRASASVHGEPRAWWPIVVFATQLALNVLWSLIFFGLRMPGLAMLEIIGLWLAIIATIIVFRPFSRAAACLLTPYLLWVTFASVLNFSIWRLNV